jgi:anti-sigma-K factor RskA
MTVREHLEIEAGEYVLGLMEAAESTAFEDRLQTDPELRAALIAVKERFHELDMTAPAPPAPGALWVRIEERLDVPVSKVVPLRPRASAPSGQGLGFWSGAAAAGFGAIVGLGLLWMMYAPAQPQLIVVLLDAQAQPGAIVEAYAGERVRVVPLARFDIPEGKVLQVWTLPSPATGPVSLGLLEGARATTLTGPDLPSPQPEQLYEITLEQAGGSPTGRPTGPIVAKGFARAPQI